MLLSFLLLLFFGYFFDEPFGLGPEFLKCLGEHGTEEQSVIRERPINHDIMDHVGGTLHRRPFKGDAFDPFAFEF
jgi:hypothetical protein